MIGAAICGEALRAAAQTLELTESAPHSIAVVDADDRAAVERAATLPSDLPRVVVAREERATLLRAAGVWRIAPTAEPHILGPLIRAALPQPSDRATGLVVVTAARGGVGRTLLVANLAHRLARRRHIWAFDITGSGALAWWLRADAQDWAELEPLARELSPEHLRIVAAEPEPGLRVIGGPGATPSTPLVLAALDAAVASHDLVLVDAPMFGRAAPAIRRQGQRTLVISYGDAASVAVLRAETLNDAWLIASQCTRVGAYPVFRALPRDERSVATAMRGGPAPVGGALGRAYSELAALLEIDAA